MATGGLSNFGIDRKIICVTSLLSKPYDPQNGNKTDKQEVLLGQENTHNHRQNMSERHDGDFNARTESDPTARPFGNQVRVFRSESDVYILIPYSQPYCNYRVYYQLPGLVITSARFLLPDLGRRGQAVERLGGWMDGRADG